MKLLVLYLVAGLLTSGMTAISQTRWPGETVWVTNVTGSNTVIRAACTLDAEIVGRLRPGQSIRVENYPLMLSQGYVWAITHTRTWRCMAVGQIISRDDEYIRWRWWVDGLPDQYEDEVLVYDLVTLKDADDADYGLLDMIKVVSYNKTLSLRDYCDPDAPLSGRVRPRKAFTIFANPLLRYGDYLWAIAPDEGETWSCVAVGEYTAQRGLPARLTWWVAVAPRIRVVHIAGR